MAERKTIQEYMDENSTIRTYYELDTAMFRAHKAGQYKEAESTARILLENTDLPLLLRARACQIIGCGNSPDFLDMATEAVRVAELAYSRCTNPGDVEQGLVDECKTALKEAQEAYDEQKKKSDRNIGKERNGGQPVTEETAGATSATGDQG